MSSRSSKPSSSSGSKKHGSSSKNSAKTDDWTEITDPEERRRIQNRIAQRKFRGKAREQKEKNERDQRNQEHAGSSYRFPEANDLSVEEDLSSLSGVPWGGLNMRYVVERGHESVSQGSPRTSDHHVFGETTTQYLSPLDGTGGYQHAAGSWDGRDGSSGGGGGEEQYYEHQQPPFYYDYDPSADYH